MTGQPDPKGLSSLFKQGVVDYLVKPLEGAKVLTAVSNAMQEHGRKVRYAG
jgi:FixJ family two-component response regulator